MTFDLEELAAREEMRDVTMRYARGVDRLDWDLVRSCYHPDAFDHHGTYQGDVNGFIEFFRREALHFEGTLHMMANFMVDVDLGRGRAQAETYCMAYHWTPPGDDAFVLLTGARYVDGFESRGGQWRIAHRRCIVDWSHKEASRPWGLADRFLRGRRGPEDPVYHPHQTDSSTGGSGD